MPDPVVVFVSYYFVHVNDKQHRSPEKRAAALVKAMLPFRELVETCVTGTFRDMIRSFTVILCDLVNSSSPIKFATLPYVWTPISGCEA
jgi:hypothetical protein